MNSNKRIFIVSLISFFLISGLGTFLHFAYELISNNLIVGIFSAVNESIWEHLKILVIPMFIVSIYEYIILKDNRDNFFISLLARILTGIILIISLYYLYTNLFGNNIDSINIAIFYVSALIAQIVWYFIMLNKPISKRINIISFISLVIILMLFIVFTFATPRLGIFKDNRDNTYGIFKYI